jgi:hypothetical protein
MNDKQNLVRWLNSTTTLCGLWLVTDTWAQFFGYWFVIEAVLMTIECAWPKDGVE